MNRSPLPAFADYCSPKVRARWILVTGRFFMGLAVLALAGCANTVLSPNMLVVPTQTDAPRQAEATRPVPSTPTANSATNSGASGLAGQAGVFPSGPLAPIEAAASTSRGSVATLAAPNDLWERIRNGFAMPDLDTDLVRDREQWYSSRPDYIFRMTERSRKYLFHIVEELERRNMPTELALLPFIESAFNPQAVSSAKAAGMWQFMPATGKYFELKQNAFRDDRRDVLASTRAALDYLQKLYGMFGDWHLALAAYNWGEGSVGRGIAKNRNAGLGTGYLDLNMPMETRFYVPKLQAVKNIVARPSAYNSKLPVIENHPYFETVNITRDIDVSLAARLAEVPLDDFKALNPSVNRPVILAAGTPQILLPWDNATIFLRNLQAYSGTRLASWTVWVAPSTMKVADAAKRVGMSETELRNSNNIPPRMMIRAGSSLLVSRPSHQQQDVGSRVADNGQMSLAPEIVLRRLVVKAGKNDTVASIARHHRVTAANVAEWNKVNPQAAFKLGQQVVLFVPAQANHKAKAKPANRVAKQAAPAKGRSTQVAKR
jgi:membrane-bound lytic murein transglycosylase D